MLANKPYAESAEQNRDVIWRVLAPRLRNARSVLEIGSGTGQHAAYFAPDLAHLEWQPSDLAEVLTGIRAWAADSGAENILDPIELDMNAPAWPARHFDAVYSANAIHIMSEPCVEALFAGMGRVLAPGGRLLLYGPFRYHGQHTSRSNVRFDRWLRDRDPESGVRDTGWLRELGAAVGLRLVEDLVMPVNNRMLVWEVR